MSLDFEEIFSLLFGRDIPFEFPAFQPNISWFDRLDWLTYRTRDCSYVVDSFGPYFSVLLDEKERQNEIVGIRIEPFKRILGFIRTIYPGIGIDGKSFLFRPLVELLTTEEHLFPKYSRERVAMLLPRICEFVGVIEIPFSLLQEVRYGCLRLSALSRKCL